MNMKGLMFVLLILFSGRVVGQAHITCGAPTLKGTPCKRIVSKIGTTCPSHNHPKSAAKAAKLTHTCNHKTITGTLCKIKVKGASSAGCRLHNNPKNPTLGYKKPSAIIKGKSKSGTIKKHTQ